MAGTKRAKPGLHHLHSTEGVAARVAAAQARAAGLDVGPLLRKAGLTLRQIEKRGTRINARNQVRFLALVAEALDDDLLGFHMAQIADLRGVGLLYYVIASSDRLDTALRRTQRYTRISNEALALKCRVAAVLTVEFDFLGVARHSDRHQMELWLTLLVRALRSLTGRNLRPVRVRMIHRRSEASPELDKFFGCRVEFGASKDEIVFAAGAAKLPLISADPYLNDILVAYCEELLARRTFKPGAFRRRVENAVVPLLPDGNARLGEITGQLGMSERTLARRLADEGTSFASIVDELRHDLARRYLSEPNLSISQVAWLLGYQEASAFTHAFRRWTGKSPTRVRARILSPAH